MEIEKKATFLKFFSDESWLHHLAYLADIFEHLNKINLRLQGPNTNILQFKDALCGLVEKIQNWNRKVNQGNFAMFENLSRFEPSGISAQTQLDISEHLQSLEREFWKYFPDLAEGVETFPRNPFLSKLNIETVPDEVQDKFLDLRNDSAGREIFKEKSLSEFWCTMF